MHCQEHIVTLTTIADGSGTAYTTLGVNGRVLQIRYVKLGSGGYDNGSTMTISGETTGTAIWTEAAVNASATRVPRQATHTTAGVAATYDGTRAVLEPVYLANERIKVQISSGGNVKTGTYYILVG